MELLDDAKIPGQRRGPGQPDTAPVGQASAPGPSQPHEVIAWESDPSSFAPRAVAARGSAQETGVAVPWRPSGRGSAGATSRVQNAQTVADWGMEERQCGQSCTGVGSSGAGL